MFYLMLKAREFNNFMRDSNVNIITEDEFIKSIGNERKDFLFFTAIFFSFILSPIKASPIDPETNNRSPFLAFCLAKILFFFVLQI